MRRIFGSSKPAAPPPSLEQAGDRLTSRGDRCGLASVLGGAFPASRCSAVSLQTHPSQPCGRPPPTPPPNAQHPYPRANRLDEQIRKCDEQLAGFREQLKKTRPGPAQEGLKRRALTVLKQKKMYEQQRQTLYGQQMNMEATRFTVESITDTVQTVQVRWAAGGLLV